MRTCRSGVDLSTQSLGSMVMRRGRPKVSTDVIASSVPTTSIFLIYGFAVGFDAQVDGHAEEVEVLVDLADGAEALVVAEAIDGVLVSERGRAGAVDPLGKEGRELLLALRFGHFFEIAGADGLVGVLAERAFEGGEEGLVADFPAQHVEDHGALFEGHGLELGREGAQAAGRWRAEWCRRRARRRKRPGGRSAGRSRPLRPRDTSARRSGPCRW